MNEPTAANLHTPPLGYKALTPFYDLAIAALTREARWRSALVGKIAPQAGDVIIDIGSGTGSLAVALHRASPNIDYVGVDPDEEAVTRARRKAARLDGNVRFFVGYFSAGQSCFNQSPNKVVSSLVLHQVPVDEKKRIIAEAFSALRPGGEIHIADYGRQSGLMRLLFRITVQALDGVEQTQPNADGIIPSLLQQAGFVNIAESLHLLTLTGSISIYSASKQDEDSLARLL